MSRQSLYSHLLKYPGTVARSNLENFLTEILCDFLNRLTPAKNYDFIRTVLFSGIKDKFDGWKKFDETVTLQWETQKTITVAGSYKYPDLICNINSKPVLVVEVKIGAGFGDRQLELYDIWLYENNPDAALILLTHFTQPPDDFLRDSPTYRISLRAKSDWSSVYQWLTTLRNCDPSLSLLIESFLAFLKEHNMAIPNLIPEDLAALETFINGPGERIGRAFQQVRQHLKGQYQLDWNRETKELGVYQCIMQDGRIASWVVLPRNRFEYSFFEWGIYYPDSPDSDKRLSENNHPGLPSKPYLYFYVYSNKCNVWETLRSHRASENPYIWSTRTLPGDKTKGYEQVVLVAAKPLDTLIAPESNVSQDIFMWVNKHFTTICQWLGI